MSLVELLPYRFIFKEDQLLSPAPEINPPEVSKPGLGYKDGRTMAHLVSESVLLRGSVLSAVAC